VRLGAEAVVASLALRNVLFSLTVPGLGAVVGPWLVLRSTPVRALAWPGAILIAAGLAVYVICVRAFAAVGSGTPGPWDPPRRVVAAGPYRWVRNPIYLSALTVVLGEAWLFMSWPLVIYAVAMAACFHLFVIGYEEPHLRREFGASYNDYARRVQRWIPHRPPPHQLTGADMSTRT
jgi:protein-S-isoprenylcysteine O-methyltransferase Ste14